MQERNLTIYFTSDLHSYIYPTDYRSQEEKDLGLFKCASQFQKDGNTLIIDGGDLLQGSPLGAFCHDTVGSAAQFAQIMNRCGYDYVTLGNHDFNYGMPYLDSYLDALRARCVCENVRWAGGGVRFPAHVHVLENGLRVRVSPEGDHVYGTLVQSAESAQWTSLDGKETRSFAVSTPVRMERRVPDLDYVTECDNRVWGCSSKENVIYACRLGDPTNWFSYRGIAADSYAVTVGSDGAFTGAATCMGYALFFKENTLHKLYGSKPSDFQLTSLRCRGVAKNAARSLCVLNETLYYLSPDGVMAWDGSIPAKVSAALDAGRLANVKQAVGGALDGRYYLHVSRENEVRLLVYDTERGLWHEEDVCSFEMASTGGQLYLWDGKAIWAADADREENWQQAGGIEDGVSFELVSGNIGLDSPEELYLSRLTLRLEAEVKSRIEVAVSYDSGAWETLAQLTADGRRCFDVPFVPRRCGSLRFRLKGRGQLTLRSLTRTSAAAKGGILAQEVN